MGWQHSPGRANETIWTLTSGYRGWLAAGSVGAVGRDRHCLGDRVGMRGAAVTSAPAV